MKFEELKNGDLLFMRDASDFSKAIIETTNSYSHVGIFFDNMIYHASRKNGVSKVNLKKYLLETGQKIFVYRYPSIDAEATKELAEKYIGYKYNHSFYPDNGTFYCSQYIAEILPIFNTIPMQFGDGEKAISDYWEDYYKDLGLHVPLGLEGTNPKQLSESEKLQFMGELEWEMPHKHS